MDFSGATTLMGTFKTFAFQSLSLAKRHCDLKFDQRIGHHATQS
jgi:hypothetical protein